MGNLQAQCSKDYSRATKFWFLSTHPKSHHMEALVPSTYM